VTVSAPTFVDRFRGRIGLLHLLAVFFDFLPPGLNQNALASQTKKVLPAGRGSYTRGSAMRALTHLHTTPLYHTAQTMRIGDKISSRIVKGYSFLNHLF
jgi:hypothetical protein